MGMSLPPATGRRLCAAAFVLVTLALCAVQAVPGALEGLAFLLPALLLALTLAARRYPCERALVALATGRRGRRRSPGRSPVPVAAPRAFVPRGGRLLASSLAVRPPPRLLSALS